MGKSRHQPAAGGVQARTSNELSRSRPRERISSSFRTGAPDPGSTFKLRRQRIEPSRFSGSLGCQGSPRACEDRRPHRPLRGGGGASGVRHPRNAGGRKGLGRSFPAPAPPPPPRARGLRIPPRGHGMSRQPDSAEKHEAPDTSLLCPHRGIRDESRRSRIRRPRGCTTPGRTARGPGACRLSRRNAMLSRLRGDRPLGEPAPAARVAR